MKTNLFVLLCLALSFSISAQKAPIKWGKINKADLNMKTYDPDPEAEAVILADYASLEFDLTTGNLYYIMEHHIRIKILKKSAFERGDISINYYDYNQSERISGLKAQVILPNGKEIKVKKNSMFDEKINKYWSSRKFAFPSLEEGCIIEYKYTKRSDQIYYLTDWYFQSDIPTRLSEFRTNIPEWYRYISFNQGLRPVVEQEESTQPLSVPREREAIDSKIGRQGTRVSGGSIEANIIKTRYHLENIPALKQENYITTMKDYYAKISLQLQSIKYPNSPLRNVTTTWSQEAKELEKNPVFGDQINKKRYSKKLMSAAQPSLNGLSNDKEKVIALYSFISQNVSWNKGYGYTSTSLDKAFEKKSAKSGELNLMLIALCRQLNIQAFPVLISTRNHGKAMQYYPKTSQFNHVIAFIQIGEEQFLFDVGSPLRDPSLLRANSLNYDGWLMDKDNSQWIKIPTAKDSEIVVANFDIDENGNLSGEVKQSFKGYCAMTERSAYHENKEEDHKHIHEEWQGSFPDIAISTIGFENENNTAESLRCNITAHIPQAAQVTGDFIYLSPMLNLGMDENPLKLEKRTFPVDIPIQSKDQYILNFTIPDGYVVEELPENINMKMEGNAGRFQFLISQTGNKIQIINKTSITKLHYKPEEYSIIKNFFDIIVEKHGEQIVLKKG